MCGYILKNIIITRNRQFFAKHTQPAHETRNKRQSNQDANSLIQKVELFKIASEENGKMNESCNSFLFWRDCSRPN